VCFKIRGHTFEEPRPPPEASDRPTTGEAGIASEIATLAGGLGGSGDIIQSS